MSKKEEKPSQPAFIQMAMPDERRQLLYRSGLSFFFLQKN